jgi:hypothetical protein
MHMGVLPDFLHTATIEPRVLVAHWGVSVLKLDRIAFTLKAPRALVGGHLERLSYDFANRALMRIPSLEDYEQQAAAKVESAA